MKTISKVILSLCIILSVVLPLATGGTAENINQKLLNAVLHGNVDEVKNLLAQGANQNYVVVPGPREAYSGHTVLMVAADPYIYDEQRKYNNRLAIIKILLAHGAKVNVITESGSTALICAVEYGRPDIVALLLKSGAMNTINVRLKGGKTALGIANAKLISKCNMAENYAQIIINLKQHGAKE